MSVRGRKINISDKRFNNVVWVISIIYFAIIVYVVSDFKIEDTSISKGNIYDFNTGWVMIMEDGTRYEIDSLPFSAPSNAGETVVLENTIPSEYAGLTLSFLSADKTLKVYIDGSVIYEFGTNDVRDFGHTPGSICNFIDIPNFFRYGKIRIEMQSPYDGYASEVTTMQIGQRSASALKLLKDNSTNFLLNIIIAIAGIVFLFVALVSLASKRDDYGYLYMSAFCIDACVYYCIETKTLNIFYGNQTLYSVLIFLFLMIFPAYIMLYFKKTWEKRYTKILILMIGLCYLNTIVQLILQVVFNVEDFMEMASISHFLLFVCIIVGLVISIDRIKRLKTFDAALEFIGFLSMGLGAMIDLVRNYFIKIGDFGKYSRWGMVLFCVINAVVSVRKLANGYSESVKENALLLERQVQSIETKNKELVEANTRAEEAKREAQAASEAKSIFLANMSHEIRTPINALLGMNTMILKESNQSEIREYALDIQNAGQTLLALINDILDFSKIESGNMEIVCANYDLSSVVNDCYNMISPVAKDKGLEFKLENDLSIPYMLYGDEVRVRQIILNLLSNAVKYTREGSITFELGYDRVDREHIILKISVADTGIGIEEKNIDKIFDSFKRIEETKNRTIQGTGLGLTITKRLVDQMNGKISVESEYGKGSTFFIEIPQTVVDDVPIGNLSSKFGKNIDNIEVYSERFTAPDAQILIVDDVAMNLKVMVSLLKNTKIQMDTVQSGQDCLEYITKKKYDIIFLDHMMPEMDGVEVLERMRTMEDNLNKETPIIMLTANAIVGAEEEYLDLGFTDYMSKPVREDKLEEMIMKYLPSNLVIKAQTDFTDIDTSRPLLENLNFLNTEKGLAYCGDSVDIYREILVEFAQAKRDLDLQHYFDTRDWNNYKIQVHALKSTSLTIGAEEVAAMAKSMEMATRENDYDYIREHHDAMITALVELLAKLRYILGCSE
jgi:signal transduction histidine kinase/FixJ family two-component response regulator/HPt (histidine-containing phosphotransfer) domain-containing protein